jgi:peptide/nickel transport system permease protein
MSALIPQLLAVSVVTFILIRLLPGNPADLILGPHRTEAGVEALTREMGLDRPLPVQYWMYLKDILHGDLGRSWFSGEPVLDELLRRAPATLELVGYSMAVAMILGIAIGTISAFRAAGLFGRLLDWYIRLAGSFPDFWIALIAVYIFYYLLGWAPAPMGRMGIVFEEIQQITGFHTIDTIITGRWDMLGVAIAHLVLPVLTLGIILAPIVGKVMRATMLEVLETDFIRYARACGLRRSTVTLYTIRNALPPTVTLLGILFAYLLGGAVLMEKVFSWGGVGLYSVQAIMNSDYAAVQGFVLVAAGFTMIVYLVVDVVHMILDPRVMHY